MTTPAPVADSARSANDPQIPELRRDFVRVLLLPALSLLALPLIGWAFSVHAVHEVDARVVKAIAHNIDEAADIPAAEKPLAKAFYEATPPSVACASDDPERAEYREAVCKTGGDLWQFVMARRASEFSLGVGVFGLLAALGLGFVVSRAPRLQYRAFVTGKALLIVVSAVEVVVQGTLATWLSYWVTALFMNIYVPKLILIIGVLAAMGMWTALRAIFRRAHFTQEVEGELVSREDAPGLWERLTELASRVGTPAPVTVISGIDDNFFVTEAKLKVGDREVDGRSLFVSIPLLRALSTSEADSVLAHELAHFRGGDTTESAKLSPALIRYDTSLNELGNGLLTLPAFFVMRMFRTVFEFARQKERRERELIADRVAAQTTSPDDLSRALLKTTAYSSHRHATEKQLFDINEKHTSSLALKDRVAAGLHAHVATAQFLETVRSFNVPHPFDSHPPLNERLKSLGSALTPKDCEALFKEPPATSWADQFPAATTTEDRLWAAYEKRFADAHERSLAYRYLPEGDQERALVETFFPNTTFTNKNGGQILITHAFIETTDGTRLLFRDVLSATVNDGNFSTYLQINHRSDSDAGPGPTKINLRKLGGAKAMEQFKAVFARNWQRDTAARQFVDAQRLKSVSASGDL
jgi:Zn-dependent protease with chaperone function